MAPRKIKLPAAMVRRMQRLAQQQAWQKYMQAKLSMVQHAWPDMCDCSTMCFKQRPLKAQCPVHKAQPDQGISACYSLLVQYFPGCIILAEVPGQSVDGAKGRAFGTGQFTACPDIWFDFIVLHSDTKLCFAVEVCGKEHNDKNSKPKRDQKKERFAGTVCLPVEWLYLHGDDIDWNAQLQARAQWMNGE